MAKGRYDAKAAFEKVRPEVVKLSALGLPWEEISKRVGINVCSLHRMCKLAGIKKASAWHGKAMGYGNRPVKVASAPRVPDRPLEGAKRFLMTKFEAVYSARTVGKKGDLTMVGSKGWLTPDEVLALACKKGFRNGE